MEKQFMKLLMIVLFGLSIVFFIYFIYMLSVSGSYIAVMTDAGEVSVGKNFGQIVQYFMKNTSSYLFYSVCLAYMGVIMRMKTKGSYLENKTSNES